MTSTTSTMARSLSACAASWASASWSECRILSCAALAGILPASAAQLKILHSDQLAEAQDAAQALKDLAIVLVVLVIALYVLAMVLARGRRRRTLMAIGGGFVVVGILVLV